jgi:hypothetical protein
VFYACGGRIPPWRDWSRRACGPQLSRAPVMIKESCVVPQNPHPWHFRRARKTIDIYTDDPDQEIWFRLSEDESEYSTRKKLKKYFEGEGIELDDVQVESSARYFSYCIRQAREYFRAAEGVSILTKPLLLFYGMVCLAKTLILLKKPDYPRLLGVERSRRAHGLGYRDDESSPSLVEEDQVTIQDNGTFADLYRTYKEELPVGRFYSIRDLMGWIPELYPQIGMYDRFRMKLASGNSDIIAWEGKVRLMLHVFNAGQFREGELYDLYPFLKEHFEVSEADPGLQFMGKTSQVTREQTSDRTRETSAVAELEQVLSEHSRYSYFTIMYLLPLPEKLQLNPLLASYMLMYGLSRVCRYMPDKWGRVIEGKESNERWLLERYVHLASKAFPWEVYQVYVGKPVQLQSYR